MGLKEVHSSSPGYRVQVIIIYFYLHDSIIFSLFFNSTSSQEKKILHTGHFTSVILRHIRNILALRFRHLVILGYDLISLALPGGSPWAFGQTEPIGSVPRSFGQFGHQKPGTDRSLQKTKTEEVRSRLVRFGLGHDRTNRT